jgi:hypothetical protein
MDGIHLHVDSADGGPCGECAEIDRDMFERIIRKQRHAIAWSDSSLGEKGAHALDQETKLSVRDRAAILDRNKVRLVRVKRRSGCDPIS